jgi:hypothetical protein
VSIGPILPAKSPPVTCRGVVLSRTCRMSERGTTGTVNRQHPLIRARRWRWQGRGWAAAGRWPPLGCLLNIKLIEALIGSSSLIEKKWARNGLAKRRPPGGQGATPRGHNGGGVFRDIDSAWHARYPSTPTGARGRSRRGIMTRQLALVALIAAAIGGTVLVGTVLLLPQSAQACDPAPCAPKPK